MLIGFGQPNDLAHVQLRSELSKKFGLFGKVPMWGGIKLHELYPPASTVLVRFLSMIGSINIYFALTMLLWTLNRDLVTAVLFCLSYFTLSPMLYTGRFPECFGYLCVVLAFFTPYPIAAGFWLGVAGLFHPLPLLFGSLIMFTRLNWVFYMVAFCVCGWWYIPFVWKIRKFGYLNEWRRDKIFGIYITSWSMLVNLLIFLFIPSLAWIGLIPWVFRYRLLGWKPYYLSDLIKDHPWLDGIKKSPIVIIQGTGRLLTIGNRIWASALYLLKKNIIVYNGLPATDATNIKLPKLKTCVIK